MRVLATLVIIFVIVYTWVYTVYPTVLAQALIYLAPTQIYSIKPPKRNYYCSKVIIEPYGEFKIVTHLKGNK